MDKNKSFFEGYQPNYYFNNLNQPSEEEIQELISKAILTSKDKYASCDSLSKPITLEDIKKSIEEINKIPPAPIEIEIGRIAWEILISKLNIHVVHIIVKLVCYLASI